MESMGSNNPPQSVADSRDFSRFLARISSAPSWGCQTDGAATSEGGFSSIRLRIRDPETGRWHVRQLRAVVENGVPRIAYSAAEFDSDEAELAARGGDEPL